MANPGEASGASGGASGAKSAAHGGAQIVEQDGVWVGPLRRPVNASAGSRGSIHDDATARKLGFRGGTVAGSVHLEQLPPLMLRAFGSRWFESGGVSMYFLNATTDGEPVRGFLRPAAGPGASRAECWMEREDGLRVGEGTASVGGPDPESALRARLARPSPRGDVRILAAREPGQRVGPIPVSISLEDQQQRMKISTEPLDWYVGRSPWGGPILTPATLVRALRGVADQLPRLRGGPGAVGLFGAIELQHLQGPVFADREYRCSAEILAVGETPRSEYFWFESRLEDAEHRGPVAAMLMMLRFMKGSSPLWSAGQGG